MALDHWSGLRTKEGLLLKVGNYELRVGAPTGDVDDKGSQNIYINGVESRIALAAAPGQKPPLPPEVVMLVYDHVDVGAGAMMIFRSGSIVTGGEVGFELLADNTAILGQGTVVPVPKPQQPAGPPAQPAARLAWRTALYGALAGAAAVGLAWALAATGSRCTSGQVQRGQCVSGGQVHRQRRRQQQ